VLLPTHLYLDWDRMAPDIPDFGCELVAVMAEEYRGMTWPGAVSQRLAEGWTSRSQRSAPSHPSTRQQPVMVSTDCLEL
jgi:hypothetical protein